MEYTSDVPRWKGKIHTADYMTFPQLVKWERAIEKARALPESDDIIPFYWELLPSAIDIITRWEIEGLTGNVTPDNFPGSPALAAFVVNSINNLFDKTNETTDPNLAGES